jgi:CheY-like chemotaxis protein
LARKILLADDSVTAQNMGRKILTDAGYEVITVNNGSAALKRVGEQKPDLIVLDVYMPGYSGLEVCQRLKDAPDTARIPILLTVGKLEPFKPEEARRVNADAFIVKPFEASELLSALTRLEDRMVPQAEGGRFASSVSGIERFTGETGYGRKSETSGGETDTGWKNRIRFPSEKKKTEESEPEPEDFRTTTPSRDYRRGAGRPPAASAPFAVRATPGQEPGLVPDIPRDITPDELDALSALVAKLDGPILASDDIAPIGGKLVPAALPAAPAEARTEVEPPAVTTSAAALDTAPPSQVAESVSPAVVAEVTPEVPELARVVPDLTPAPVDRDDEPRFAFAPSAAVASEEEKQENKIQEAACEVVSEGATLVPPTDQPIDQLQSEVPAQTESAPKVEDVSQDAPIAAQAEESMLEHVPTEEELAEALRVLTPSQPEATTAAFTREQEAVTVPADVVQALEEVGRGNGFVGHWMAEAVALSPEEAAVSLEAEMFQKFSMSPDTETPAAAADTAPVTPAPEPPAEVVEKQSVEPTVEQTAAPETAASAVPAEAEKKNEDLPSADEQEPATTFASGMQHAGNHEAASPSAVPEETPAAPEAVYQSSSEDEAGGQDDMGKDKADKTKAAWSNWHQIRAGSTPAGAASDPVQAAKDAEAGANAEEAPKAMAAAAAAGDGGMSASDSSDIANIVDSVLADLRPKIVEEIAKKLGKSRKG